MVGARRDRAEDEKGFASPGRLLTLAANLALGAVSRPATERRLTHGR